MVAQKSADFPIFRGHASCGQTSESKQWSQIFIGCC